MMIEKLCKVLAATSMVVIATAIGVIVYANRQSHEIVHYMERDIRLFSAKEICIIIVVVGGILFIASLAIILLRSSKSKQNGSISCAPTSNKLSPTSIPTISLLGFEQSSLRQMMNDEFCGPNDSIYNQLIKDINDIIATGKRGVPTRLAEIAYQLYYPAAGKGMKLRYDVPQKKSFQQWAEFFFAEIKMKAPRDLHPNKYDTFTSIKGIPMEYLFAPSWEEFKDGQKVTKYLK